MGCWAIGGPWQFQYEPNGEWGQAGWGPTDDEESIRAVHAALAAGITFFDTAANYGAGHSEIVLGRALKGRRDEAVIATKFGHVVNEAEKRVHRDNSVLVGNVRSDVENSLRRLQTDVIDVYQLHEGGLDPGPALEVRATLEDLVAEGKIRWYGWSTDLVDRAQVFGDGEHCTSIQFRLNAVHDDPDMRQVIADHDLAGINKDPLNKGILTGKFNSESAFPDNDLRKQVDWSDARWQRRLACVDALREVFTSGGRTMAQGALCYILGLDARMVPIPGIRTVKQAEDNAGALAHGPMSAAEIEQVQAIVAEYEPDEAG